jgi:hypothetical protein
MINWDLSLEDSKLIHVAAKRAVNNLKDCTVTNVSMDLTATHLNGCELDLEKLVTFNDFSFAHDILGINKHLNRCNGELDKTFLPRCAKLQQ